MISAPLIVYLLVGPLVWVLLFIGTALGRYRTGRLLGWKTNLPADPPHVTILVPAKDEGEGVRRCLDSILVQDYPRFNVIAIDDRSRDNTGAVLDDLASREPRLRVIHIADGTLPSGWLGKCHALHVGTRDAAEKSPGSEWFFFVDSDVVLQPGALSAALSIALQRKYDAVTIFTRIECHSFIERLMLPPLAASWVIMYTASLTNEDRRRDIAVANGQFFLIRRSVYEAVGGHESVRDQITEDVELMRRMKASGATVRIFMGAHLAATRMHNSLRQMFNGWARIFSGTSRRRMGRIVAAMCFIVLAVLSVYPALAWGIYRAAAVRSFDWLAAASAHYLMLSAYLMLVYHWSGNRIRYALLIPISSVIMLAIYAVSLRKCQTGRITWRDTEFAADAGAASSAARGQPGSSHEPDARRT